MRRDPVDSFRCEPTFEKVTETSESHCETVAKTRSPRPERALGLSNKVTERHIGDQTRIHMGDICALEGTNMKAYWSLFFLPPLLRKVSSCRAFSLCAI